MAQSKTVALGIIATLMAFCVLEFSSLAFKAGRAQSGAQCCCRFSTCYRLAGAGRGLEFLVPVQLLPLPPLLPLLLLPPLLLG
jgi:hypothetical protein